MAAIRPRRIPNFIALFKTLYVNSSNKKNRPQRAITTARINIFEIFCLKK